MKFSLNIKPKGKERPRFVRRGKYVSTYTPKTTLKYEEIIRNAFVEQCIGKYDKEYVGAVKVSIWAHFEPPKSYSKERREELIKNVYHINKPDLDNITKSILDALNGVAWKDDSQICDLEVHKCYEIENRIEVEIEYV